MINKINDFANNLVFLGLAEFEEIIVLVQSQKLSLNFFLDNLMIDQ